MNIIVPITITSGLIGSGCTLSEDPTAAWTSATYAVGDERHVVATHRVYRCAIAGSSTVSPELDPTRWVDVRPTNKMAPFDLYTSTAATTTSVNIVYPITARFCSAIALYGLAGSNYTVVVKDVAGGSVIYTATGRLRKTATGWYDYLFGPRMISKSIVLTGLPIRPAAEITITISAASGATRSLGMVVLGKFRPLVGSAAWGGTEAGASAEPITYSYIKTDNDGTTTIVRRHFATNLKCKLKLPRTEADTALSILQDVLDIPVAWIATTTSGYKGLTAFGIASAAPVTYESPEHATIDITVKGLI